MSQMPDSIYLHKNSKYNTSGAYFAQDENQILYENEYDESVMEDYVEYTPIYHLEEAVKQVEKDLGWHSVDESLPPVDEEVIVLLAEWNNVRVEPLYHIAFGHIVDKDYCIDYDGWNIPGVKYWMPMPKLNEIEQ